MDFECKNKELLMYSREDMEKMKGEMSNKYNKVICDKQVEIDSLKNTILTLAKML